MKVVNVGLQGVSTNLPCPPEPNLFGHISPSNSVMEINDWMASCSGQSQNAVLLCSAQHFHFSQAC